MEASSMDSIINFGLYFDFFAAWAGAALDRFAAEEGNIKSFSTYQISVPILLELMYEQV